MKKVLYRFPTVLSVHFAFVLALFSVLLPPEVLAAATQLPGATNAQDAEAATEGIPDYFTVDYPDEGLSYGLTRQANGDYLMENADGSQSQIVDAAAISQTTVDILFGDDLGGPFSATLTIPDSLGGSITYGFYGNWDPISETVDGTLVLADGTEKDLNLWVPNAGSLSLKVVIVITVVASAAAIAALGCWFLGWITNCIDDCADACEHGVKSATEGTCGTCTCECFPPPPPPCDRDGGNLRLGGEKNIYEVCPAPLPQPL